MAVFVAFSTLLVLLSGSGQNLINLWNYTGGINDPSSNKSEQELPEVIHNGSFRSASVDNWLIEAFDAVSVYGMNMFGDIFWETEFNVTGLTFELENWLLGDYITSSSADTSATQNAILNNQSYQLRLSNSTDTSWFAVSAGSLSNGTLPLIFVPRSIYMPFRYPVFMNGSLGCWKFSDLTNVVRKFRNDTMYPALCIENCMDIATVAVISKRIICYCADKGPDIEPYDDQSKCNMVCPGSSSEICGSETDDDVSAYHVQGSQLPVLLYQTHCSDVNTTIQIDIFDICESCSTPFVSNNIAISTTPAFITSIIVNVTGSSVPMYTVWYNESNCSEAAGNMKVLTNPGIGPMVFQADRSVARVDILMVRCLELVLSETVSDATVELWGPDEKSDYVKVPALVIRGKHFTQVTTTSTTSTSISTMAAPTTTMSTSTATPTPSKTTPLSSTSTRTSPSTTSSTTTTPAATTSTATSSTASSTSVPSTTSTTSSTITTILSMSSTSSSPTTTALSVSSPSTTTTPAASSISTTTSPRATTESVSHCPCNETLQQLNLTKAELQERIVEIQRLLAVNVSMLSSTIRKLTSAKDSRIYAVSVGCVGVGILVSIFAAIVFLDAPMIFRDFKKLIHNIKSGLCPHSSDSKP